MSSFLNTGQAKNQHGRAGNRKKKASFSFSGCRRVCSVQKRTYRILQQIDFQKPETIFHSFKIFFGDVTMNHFYRWKNFYTRLFVLSLFAGWATQAFGLSPYGFPPTGLESNYGETTIWSRILQHSIAAILGGILGAFYS